MTTPIINHHIDHPSAWKSSDFTGHIERLMAP